MKWQTMAIAVGSAFVLPAYAEGSGLEVKLSGQINRAVMHVDDGVDSRYFHVDNDNSSTRLRFTGTKPLTPTAKAGVVLEVEYQSNPSNLVTFGVQEGAPSFDERIVEAFYEAGWGRLGLGQGDGAANGGVEMDLSGTMVAHYSGSVDIGGAFAFRAPSGAAGPTIAQTTSQQDFESRYDRVRYDTPSFGGAIASASVGTKDTNREVKELALRYRAQSSLGQVAGALGYSNEAAPPGSASPDDRTIGGSISWLHPAGYNVTIGHTTRRITISRDGTFDYLKLGFKRGAHAVSADYGLGEDQNAVGDEARVFGLAYVYQAASWAELYALVKTHRLDRPGAEFADIHVAMAGTRLSF
ncbi:MAG TPA: porin [Burkholderiales bacterium]|nr:porin [Burkholderiales bacterium]